MAPQPTCTPDTPTQLSAGWATRQSQLADFSLGTPANWVVHEGYGAKPIGQFIDPDDVTAAALDPTSNITPDSVGAPGAAPGVPNVRVFTILGFDVPAELVRSHLAAWYGTVADNQFGRTDISACVGGAPGFGFEFTYASGASYVQFLAVDRDQTLYLVEWIATAKQRATDMFDEILRTWQWADQGLAPGASPIASAPGITAAPSESAVVIKPVVKHAPTPKPGTTPGATPVDIGAVFTANVEVYNFAAGEVDVAVKIDDGSGTFSDLTMLKLQAFDFNAVPTPPGRYRIAFTRVGSKAAPAICTAKIGKQDKIQFLVTDTQIAVARDGDPPATGQGVLVPTAAICQG